MHNNIAKKFNQKNTVSPINGAGVFALLLVGFLLVILPMGDAQAGSMESAINEVTSIVQGDLGRGAATLAVLVIGASAMMGKLSFPLAITTMIGIIILFQAGTIAKAFI